jgi:D-xylose transport system ATP-binding protein
VSGPFLFELRNVRKEFPGTVALEGIDLHGRAGEIIGLVGENGAGKSTLTKILAGVHRHGTFSGEVLVDGRERRFASVRDAEEAGVSLIPQELAAVPEMTVAENLFLNREPTRLGVVDTARMAADARRVLGWLEEDIEPRSPMYRLSVAKQQVVEIAKALAKEARLLILDEPTSSLTEREAARLFDRLRTLRDRRGVCAIYISHRIDEVQEIADRVVVLRDGAIVGQGAGGELSATEVVRLMVGRELAAMFPKATRAPGRIRLEVQDWRVPDPHLPGRLRVDGVSFDVRAGEVLGVFGAVGAGRSELLMSLMGAYTTSGRGALRVDGALVEPRRPADALRAGMILVTEDRRRFGIEPFMSVGENLTLAALARVAPHVFVNGEREAELMREQVERLSIATRSIHASILSLSGGNQQKVLLGRALLGEPGVLLLDEPTRGIDVGAKADIFALIERLVEEGMAVVMVSSEPEEVLGFADRILVLREGRAVGVLDASELTVERLVALASASSRSVA